MIIVVKIPPGVETPYVHNDGRVYRRVADSSAPKPETDRHILDRLWARGEKSKKKLADFVSRLPVTSKGEDDECFLHISIMSDPYEIGGDWYSGGFDEFAKAMRGNPIPFDNVYPKSGGFVARQAKNNPARNRVFTWEFSRFCHSFITFPLGRLSEPYEGSLSLYSCGEIFGGVLYDSKLEGSRVLDLNVLFEMLAAIVTRHRALVSKCGVSGPFYVKAHIENAWRTIPFLDLSVFVEHVKEYGVPVVQDRNILVPSGVDFESFVCISERSSSQSIEMESYRDSMLLMVPILAAMGIPDKVIRDGIDDLLKLAGKFKEFQDVRNRISGN